MSGERLFPLTLTLSLGERSPPILYTPSTPEPGDVRRFLPLFPTQEGGEGWGEEGFLFWITPLSGSLPARASRGEREKVAPQIPVLGHEQEGRGRNRALPLGTGWKPVLLILAFGIDDPGFCNTAQDPGADHDPGIVDRCCGGQ